MVKRIISLTLDEDVINTLDKRAKNDVRSRSAMANFLIKKSLE